MPLTSRTAVASGRPSWLTRRRARGASGQLAIVLPGPPRPRRRSARSVSRSKRSFWAATAGFDDLQRHAGCARLVQSPCPVAPARTLSTSTSAREKSSGTSAQHRVAELHSLSKIEFLDQPLELAATCALVGVNAGPFSRGRRDRRPAQAAGHGGRHRAPSRDRARPLLARRRGSSVLRAAPACARRRARRPLEVHGPALTPEERAHRGELERLVEELDLERARQARPCGAPLRGAGAVLRAPTCSSTTCGRARPTRSSTRRAPLPAGARVEPGLRHAAARRAPLRAGDPRGLADRLPRARSPATSAPARPQLRERVAAVALGRATGPTRVLATVERR